MDTLQTVLNVLGAMFIMAGSCSLALLVLIAACWVIGKIDHEV